MNVNKLNSIFILAIILNFKQKSIDVDTERYTHIRHKIGPYFTPAFLGSLGFYFPTEREERGKTRTYIYLIK